MNERITSAQNPRVKALAGLRKRKEREAAGVVLVEGARELSRALDAGLAVRSAWVCTERLRGDEHELLARMDPAAINEVAPHVFEKIAYREHPGGLLVELRCAPRRLADVSLTSLPLVLVIEGVEKPGNLGAVLRSADAAGVDAVLACDCPIDLYNANAVRASLGTVFSLTVVEATSAEARAWLAERGLPVVAASPAAEREYFDAELARPCALALGSEAEGLSAVWTADAERVRIPMAGAADSLNVSVSAALMLFEAVRQRRAHR